MEFRLLGPVSVVEHGKEVDLGAPKQRALLALLLLHRNDPVSSERLIDWLWAGQPPASAQKALQVYVSGLRKVLGAERLETHGRAYLLRVDPGELDLDRFDSLVHRAHDAEPAQAASLLREAIELFRGEPLSELRYDEVARAEITRLEELRLHTLEERIDADLALGRHDELVPELEGLIAAHPLRERLRYQQMLALYRAGRQADALEAYRQAQRVLDEELGLEPGPELRRLERQILDQDPELAARTPTPRLVRPRRLRQRRLALVLAVGGAVILSAAIAGAVIASSRSGVGLRSAVPDSVGVIDPGSNRLVAQIPVGFGPTSVTVDGRNVWVVNAGDRTLSRIDAKTRHVTAVTTLARTPAAVAAGGSGSVWVANAIGDTGSISRVFRPEAGASRTVAFTTRKGYADLYAPPTPSAIAVASGGVWANSNPSGLLVYLHPSTGLVDHFLLGPNLSVDGIAVGEGAVWIASGANDAVIRFDPKTHRFKTISVAGAGLNRAGPYGIAIGEGSVWVTDALADTVSRIDPRAGAVTQIIPVGPRPTAVAVADGIVWVLNRGNGTVSRIDPKKNAVAAKIHVGPDVTGLAAGAGAVWVTVAGGPAIKQRGPAARLAPPLPQSSCLPIISGGTRPRFLIASDLPSIMAGQPSTDSRQMQQAIRLVLEQHGYRAGPYSVGYQACDDSTGAAGGWDPVRCAANAHLYAGNPSLIAVIGTYNSSCTGIELPITNASPTGPVATISPANTYPGLTLSGPATGLLEPDQYYPTGVRSFTRVVGSDQAQGAADALLAASLGLSRIYLLSDQTGSAVADATYTARAASRLGLHVVGRAAWNPRTNQYAGLIQRVVAARPNGVYLSGWCGANGCKLFRDLKTALGPHVTFFASDNFGAPGPGDPWSPGLYESVAGLPLTHLGKAGRRFLDDFQARYHQATVGSDVVAAAQSAEIVLDAIGRSNGTRPSVTRQLLADQIYDGPLGTFHFDANGDPTKSPFAVYRFPPARAQGRPPFLSQADNGARLYRVIIAPPDLAGQP